MTSSPERLLVPSEQVRWTCPRRWTQAPDTVPEGPPELWTQPRPRDALRAAAAGFERGVVRHLEVAVPTSPGWVQVVAAALSGQGPRVHPAPVVSEAELRGRGEDGLIARAHGGILVVDVHDAHNDKIERALSAAALAGTVTPLAAKDGESEPVEVHVMIVVVGPEGALRKWREDRPRVRSWARRRVLIEPDVPATAESARLLAERLRRFAERTGLPRPTGGAAALLIESLQADGRRGRLSQDLAHAEDLLLEARAAGRPALAAAETRLRTRYAAKEDAHRERLGNGRLRVRAGTPEVGVVNGLMVYGAGRAAYSIPGRISARVAVGRQGVINVEREAKYSGRSFDKGMFQLAAWLRATFAGESPLGVAASVALEQSNGRIDGDSATLAEVLAILSALSGVPCRQDIGVTGAMNQRGEVLPIGSLNRKVDGWWRACRALDAPPGGGVLIPAVNIPDLHLSPPVAAAVAEGSFHVWAVADIEEAVEVALGRPAGKPRGGRYPKDSVYRLAAARLGRMSARLFPPRKKPKPPEPKADG